MKNLLKFIKGYKMVFIVAVISVIGATAMQVTVPILIKYAVDSVIGTEDPGKMTFIMNTFGRNIISVVLLITAVSFIRGLLMFIKGYLSNYAAENIVENTRNKLFKHIQDLPFEYHSKRETGDLIQRCTSDLEMIRKFLSIQIVDLGRIIFLVSLSIAVMLSLNVKLTLYAIILIPIIFIFCFLFFGSIQKQFKIADETEGELTTVLQENLSGVRVVRAFGREKYEIDKFDKVNEKHRAISFKLMEFLAMFWSFSDLMTYFQNAITLIVGAKMAINGEITLGTLIAFMTYETMLIFPVKQLGRMLSELGKTTVSVSRIKAIFEEPTERVYDNECEPEIKGSIEFDKVSFQYHDGNQALNEISFKVEAGQTLGILGSTGSGKSTLVNLLQRLYEYEGHIKIDGIELNTIKKPWIRSKIGLILQEPHLYAKTVGENIGIISPSFSESQIKRAAETASIHNDIMAFKEGYETTVGEKGVSLSGGQKQRIAISRTIIDDQKPILIFDDSLSAVDTETDMKIRRALKQRAGQSTEIIISHRITTLSESDYIIVMDEGQIIQRGTHDSLIQEEGVYKRIWDLQQLAVI